MGKYFSKDIFGARLMELMKDNNDTTYSLGEYLHLSAASISRYINGEMAPKILTIEVLAKKYNVNPAWLMGSDIPKHQDVEEFKKVPVVGSIAAGRPIYAEEYIEGYESVPQNSGIDFCLRVKGNSMINARIFDGDIVYIQKMNDVNDGEIAAVIIDGEEATLKRIFRKSGQVILHAENPTYPDMIFTSSDKKDIKILGRAKYVKFEAI